MSLFGKPKDDGRAEAIRTLKEAARTLFGATDDDAVVVSELRCSEPGCPPVETVVALLRPGGDKRQVKIHKPVIEVTAHDIRMALDSSCHGTSEPLQKE